MIVWFVHSECNIFMPEPTVQKVHYKAQHTNMPLCNKVQNVYHRVRLMRVDTFTTNLSLYRIERKMQSIPPLIDHTKTFYNWASWHHYVYKD